MAEAIGLAILSAVSVESTVVVGTITTAAIVGNVALLGAGVALSAAASAIQGDQQKVAAQQSASRQPLPSRQRSYGRVKVAGPYVAYDTVAGAFIYANYHGEGPWAGIDEWWLDDINTALPAGSNGGLVQAIPWRGYVGIESHLGTPNQVRSPLLAALPYWGESHRLQGCVYSAVRNAAPPEKKFKAYFPKGTWSPLRVTARTSLVRDLSDPAQTSDPATWRWSDRSGPCIYDFLTHPLWGLRVPTALMNAPKWAAFAALCNENVTSKDGSVFPRYFLGGTYQMTDDPIDTLNAMLSTCDGSLTLEPDGTIGIAGGRYPTPTVTITDPVILSMTIEFGGSRLVEFNRLKLSFVSPLHDYQQVEGQAWDDATAQAASGELLEKDFSRPWVQNFNQLRRLAKIAMAKGNPEIKITGMVTDSSAAPALFEESVRLQFSLLGIDATFLVGRAVANIDAGTCTFDLSSIGPDVYTFDAVTEEGIPPVIPNADVTVSNPAEPANLSVSVERRAVSGSNNATFLRLTADPTIRQDLSLVGRYRIVGSADWIEMVADSQDNPFSLTSGVLSDGSTYEAQGAITTYGRASLSNYVTADPATVQAVADTTAPAQPTGFVVNGGVGQAMLAWTNPGDANFAATRVFRGTTTSFAGATRIKTINSAPSQALDFTDSSLPPGTYSYWVSAVNGSGVASSPNGPMTVTVT